MSGYILVAQIIILALLLVGLTVGIIGIICWLVDRR